MVGHSIGRPAPRPLLVPSAPRHQFTINQLDLLQPLSDPDLTEGPSLYDTWTVSTNLHNETTNKHQPSVQDSAVAVPVSGVRASGKCAVEHPAIPRTTKTRVIAPKLYEDRLGKLVSELSTRLSAAASWEAFVNHVRGPSYLADDIHNIPHQASAYLQTLRDTGAAVNMDDPRWSDERIQSCVARGPHPSANLHRDFLRDEYADFIEAGFWVVLPLDQVRALNKDLRISPMAVKVEPNRRPRVIVDHTWFGVNDHTIPDLPREVMQFGGALPRILWLLCHADPSAGPVYLSKYDITDGFFRKVYHGHLRVVTKELYT